MPNGSGLPDFTGGNYLGSDFGFLRQQYRNLFEEGDPFIQDMIETGTKRIGMQSREAKSDIEEGLSQSGFRGAGANLYTALFEEEGQQIQELTTKGAGLQSQVRQGALGALSGLSQFEGQQEFNVAGMQEKIRQYEKTFAENVRQFGMDYALRQRELDLKEEEMSGGGFLGGLGSLLGGGINLLSGGVFGAGADILGGLVTDWLG